MAFFTRRQKKQTGFIAEMRQISFVLIVVFLIRTFIFGLYQVPTGSMETTMLVGEFFFADKFTYLFSKPQRGHVISLNSPLFKYSENSAKRLFQEYVWGPQNLTKRIIGVPGDLVEGKIENGKPVIYLNNKKLDEPYLNKYPLITVWRTDPRQLAKTTQNEALSLISQNKLTPEQFEDYFNDNLSRNIVRKSYDPAFSYQDQPFYRINEKFVAKDATHGTPDVVYPGAIIVESKFGQEVPKEFMNYWDRTDVFRVKLGENQYWLMGDNRLNSADSRVFGPVDGRLIHGRILFRIFSVDSDQSWIIVHMIKHPLDFIQRIRWNRALQLVR